MGFVNLLASIFLLVLVLMGGIYVCRYEPVPLGEKIQILSVGFGIWIGSLFLLFKELL